MLEEQAKFMKENLFKGKVYLTFEDFQNLFQIPLNQIALKYGFQKNMLINNVNEPMKNGSK